MDDPTIPTVKNKTMPPQGILPRNAQARLIGAIALLMVLIIAFSGRQAPKKTEAPISTQVPAAVDANQARIQEYRARIEEQARKLAIEQAQLMQTQQVVEHTANSPMAPGEPRNYENLPGSARWAAPNTPAIEKNPLDDERAKREYLSLFSSNLALSYRRDTQPQESAPSVAGAAAPSPPAGAKAFTEHDVKVAPETLKSSEQRDGFRLFEGTVIETVLTNRLDGAFSGPVNCMVTANVYSHDGQRLLIPQGSRALGEVKRVETFGQDRLAVFFHRLIMPDGYSISLDQFHGLNQIGETGLRDQVNHHYLQVFSASLAIGLIGGLSQANTRYGTDTSAGDVYRQGVASSLSQSSQHVLDRYLNVLPTFTIREGHRVKVYLSEDLLLPAYETHSNAPNQHTEQEDATHSDAIHLNKERPLPGDL